ncbi:hypothetical protein CsSME_00051578 [Camellia sinensis var. sinensis]
MPSTGNYRMRSRRRRKRDTSTFLSSSSSSAGSSPQLDEYSDDKVEAQLQLAAVFALTLGTLQEIVRFSFLGRDFYNALANKDQEQFTKQLLYYLGAFAGGIPVSKLLYFLRETLSLRWRSWMTNYYIDRYLKNRTFYKIQSQSIIDNPDPRIVDDLSSFTGTALSFSLTLFNAAVDLVSFSNILYGIYPPLFAVLVVYSISGTAISVFLGRGLVTLNFLQEKKEADFRFGLVRLRENAESIAFYAGEDNEKQLLLQRFRSAFENLTGLRTQQQAFQAQPTVVGGHPSQDEASRRSPRTRRLPSEFTQDQTTPFGSSTHIQMAEITSESTTRIQPPQVESLIMPTQYENYNPSLKITTSLFNG